MKGKKCPALHVVDAGSVGDIALDLEGQAVDETHRMHRVEMRQYEDAAIAHTPARARDQVIAETVAARNTLEPGARTPIGLLHVVDHAVDRLGQRGWALDFDPCADLCEHARRVEVRLFHPIPRCAIHATLSTNRRAARMADTTRFWPRVSCVCAKPRTSFGMVRISPAVLRVGSGGIGTAGSCLKRASRVKLIGTSMRARPMMTAFA